MIRILTILLIAAFTAQVTAQDGEAVPGNGAEVNDTVPARTWDESRTKSGYENRDNIGGPTSVGARLNLDDQEKVSITEIPEKASKFWFDFKKKVNEKTGLEYQFAYTNVLTAYGKKNDDETQVYAASGSLDIMLGAKIVGWKHPEHNGSIYVRMVHRHNYLKPDKATPMYFGFENGASHLVGTTFRDYTFRFNELQYTQKLFDSRLGFAIGKVDPTNYFTAHALIAPTNQFLGYAIASHPVINWPDPGWGVVMAGAPHPNLYVGFGLHDARGDVYRDGQPLYGGRDFFDGRFFYVAEVGYVASFEERYFKRISFNYSHTAQYVDAVADVVSNVNNSYAFNAMWMFKDKFLPMVKFGISNGEGFNVLSRANVAVANGMRFKSHDMLGVGFAWDRPVGDDPRDQYIMEVYYRLNLLDNFEISPDLQLVIHPAFAPEKDIGAYISIRTRVTL